MKRLLIALMLCLPLVVNAKQGQDDTPYMVGAVPEVNGVVTFTKSFKVPGKSQEDIYNIIKPWMQNLVDNSIPAPGNYARFAMDTQDTIVAKVCEFQVYKKKFAYLDRSRFRYTIIAFIQNERIEIQLTGINYYYNENLDGTGGTNYHAEEWINDASALNKKKTKLLPGSAKFRRKTVDRANELFEQIMDTFEQKITLQETQKTRRNIVEE